MKLTNITLLLEKNRQELLNKQKRETPERVQRAKSYIVSQINIDANALLNDWLVITTTISGNSHMYTDSIAFKNVMTDLIQLAKIDSKHYVNSKLIIRSIKRSLDKQDIYISCDCDDFKFRYDYHATQGKFKWGKLQNSNGKGIRNPHNDIGCMCKHLYALLRSNNFLDKVSDKIMRTIMANLDVLVKTFNINLEEFIVNSERYDRMLKMNISRTKGGQFTKNVPDTNKNNEKENIPENTSEKKQESIMESANVSNETLENIIQYYTTSQILEQFKEKISEEDYIKFVLTYGRKNNKTFEDYLINNISEIQLLNFIKEYNVHAWNTLINEILNIII